MPAFVKHEEDWERAKEQARKQNLKGDKFWKYTTAIYKKMRPEDFVKEASVIILSTRHKGY